ncbi:radical SAM family heme chaperone HemW [Notoacmeibacter sp. MSK16QG-6]|uniref:radical SAM family heme chaperone HemW n=1 Tax=Notoacmeibacter sp. MSK16QG-6 TaxID=2957982 RepID=UPI0020A019C8|nr:radical SAM family heme chaperone HemW [Notoacmeibacter sp. MSK16QG-6]MCP1198903.1 radical SAM family heme chaperone HemW [Notoacmeibacter sp. MSK16QG-6]
MFAEPAMHTPSPINGDDGAPGFGIYLHWPFCAAKCPYCDFNSHVRHDRPDQARFAKAFASELAAMREETGPREVTSVFIGGGTPSLMEVETVATILEAANRVYSLPAGIEITMEANPQSAEAGRFASYREAGVNRLSLGVQSLIDTDLRFLGRLHDVAEARAAIELARQTFPRLSFDLIYARPGQTMEGWAAELNAAIDLAADHLSLYQLTIEDGTAFKRLYDAKKFRLPEEGLAADLYAITQDITAERGLPAYEVSNHAVPGAESRHNLTYWRYGEYVGVGPGAHGRFRFEDGRRVTMAERHPERWLEMVEESGAGTAEIEQLTDYEQADEMLLMGLRLTEGLDLARYEAIAGRDLAPERLSLLIDEGFVEPLGNSRVRATRAGMVVLDAVVADLAA